MRSSTLISLAMLGLPAALVGQAATGALRSEVEAAVRAYVAAHNKGDAGAAAAMYSTQAGVISVGAGGIVRGWDRIRERMGVEDSLMVAQGHLAITLGSMDITSLGKDFVLVTAPYTMAAAAQSAEVRQRGAMTLVLQKVGGQWKIIHEHTSTMPQPAATTAAAPAPRAAPPLAAAPPAAQPSAPPAGGTTIAIVAGVVPQIPAAQALHYDFVIPAGVCTVTGRVEGISGGNQDFEVMILDDDNYRNWSAGLQARAYGASGRVTVTNINAPIPGPGTYHLVVNNPSVSTPKTVQVWAQAQCP